MSQALLAMFAEPARARFASLPFAGMLDALRRHRLLPLALAGAPASDPLLQPLAETLSRDASQRVAREDALIERVLGALAACGCAALVLKGAALGRWLYARPEWRPGSDVDLLVDPDHRFDAHAALVGAGLESDGYSQYDEASRQASYADPRSRCQLDVHWALSVVPEFARHFCFDELRAASIPLRGPAGARGLGRVDALMHAVLHYRAHLPESDRPAIWLHDIALLASGMDAADWERLDGRVRACGLAGLHAATLVEAASWFPLDLPIARIESWTRLGTREGTRHWLAPDPRPLARLLRSLRALPGLRPRLQFLRTRLFPGVRWMRGRYGARTRGQLLRAYLRRWFAGARQLLGRT